MKIVIILLVSALILADFNIAGAQNIINITEDYVQELPEEDDNEDDFQPLPGDPGVEVAPLYDNMPSEQNADNQTSTTDIIIDDSSGE